MLKINYPKESALAKFHLEFINIFKSAFEGDHVLTKLLSNFRLQNGELLTWDYLLTAEFNVLINLNSQLQNSYGIECNDLKLLTEYNNFSAQISQFFIQQEQLNIHSCYYCNIDSIYTFNLWDDFKDGLDFINRATISQLKKFSGIGYKTANKIIAKKSKCGKFRSIDECPCSQSIRGKLKTFDFSEKSTHSHFQIDHYLPQFRFPYLSLCLYNLVPCCYVCNSKFKNKFLLYDGDPTISNPGSSLYSLDRDVCFKLLYHKSSTHITGSNDYSVELQVKKNHLSHEVYIDRLNILGRYKLHKKLAFVLIKLKEKYPDSLIQQIANKMGKSQEEIKKDIFGRELFEHEYDNSSLIKFKRDIAKELKII